MSIAKLAGNTIGEQSFGKETVEVIVKVTCVTTFQSSQIETGRRAGEEEGGECDEGEEGDSESGDTSDTDRHSANRAESTFGRLGSFRRIRRNSVIRVGTKWWKESDRHCGEEADQDRYKRGGRGAIRSAW
jgi:hypothetical protein